MTEFHEQFPEEFADAVAVGRFAAVGWCGGRGESLPKLTEVQREGVDRSFAEVFNAGVALGRKVSA